MLATGSGFAAPQEDDGEEEEEPFLSCRASEQRPRFCGPRLCQPAPKRQREPWLNKVRSTSEASSVGVAAMLICSSGNEARMPRGELGAV